MMDELQRLIDPSGEALLLGSGELLSARNKIFLEFDSF